MKFSIRETMLVTLVVAVLLGWLVDHWRAAAGDATWEREFERSLQALSPHVRETMTFETPSGTWRVVPDKDVSNKVVKPR